MFPKRTWAVCVGNTIIPTEFAKLGALEWFIGTGATMASTDRLSNGQWIVVQSKLVQQQQQQHQR